MPDRAAQLAALRAVANSRLSRVDAELASLRGLRRATSDDDEHDPDGVPMSEEWSRLEGMRTAALTTLAELDAAATRIATGDDDRCRRCGGPIDPRRLEARPAATTCIECAS